jgi:F0F1-type ATP synthase membrane subunit b/b'
MWYVIAVVVLVVIWFLLLGPMERRLHRRRQALIARKLERAEARRQQEGSVHGRSRREQDER